MSITSAKPVIIRLHRVCPLLERATETKVLPYAPAPWLLRQCRETGFVYLENPPEYAAFQDEFAWEVTKEKESQRRSADEPWFYAFRVWFRDTRVRVRCRNRKVIDLAAAWIKSQPAQPFSLVELGCGNGENLLRIMAMLPADVARRCSPQGVELSTQLAREADDALQAFGGACLHHHALGGVALFPDASQDLIILANFLEHEINPLPLLRLCREKLKRSGRIIVKVPNFACFSRHIRGERWCGFRWPDHVNYFTPQTLTQMAEIAGLSIARLGLADRSPLNDNMYAILKK
jgi:predicted SAM-dependent methyltransferase